MNLIATLLFLFFSLFVFGQSIDDSFSRNDMTKDLEIFKEIRMQANSGLYKYRTKQQIDSIYHWAENEINKSSTYLDFYNIICKLTDYEGSCHNDTYLPDKYLKNLRAESSGYFPYPIKWIDGGWRVNFDKGDIPVGSEIITINQIPISEIMLVLYRYFSTDGANTTGKRIGIGVHFARYFRLYYGRNDVFEVEYQLANSNVVKTKTLESVASSNYYKNFNARYSKSYDQIYFKSLSEDEKYKYDQINESTGILTIHTFSMGNENADEHKSYCDFLDKLFGDVKINGTKNLIVDVRRNGGGTDPNDLVTYSYLTQRNFQENKEAWISFQKAPMIRYMDFWVPKILRPLCIGIYNRQFKKEFPLSKNEKFYQDENSQDHIMRGPHENAFIGNIYLLVSPRVASAGSLFAAMVAGNESVITIGEETMGGYYGHNGHTSMAYKLPKSKLELSFFIVNLEQDVPRKYNQYYDRGIVPTFEVTQTYEDYIKHEDTQLNYVLEMIKLK